MDTWPTWLQFLTAVGAGGIFIKVLDLIFLQSQTAKREYWNWLRDKRFTTYSELIDVLTWEAEKNEELGLAYSEIRGKAIRASILVEDEMLQRGIELCISEISKAVECWKDREDPVMVNEYTKVSAEARGYADRIIEILKRDLLSLPPTGISIFWMRHKIRWRKIIRRMRMRRKLGRKKWKRWKQLERQADTRKPEYPF